MILKIGKEYWSKRFHEEVILKEIVNDMYVKVELDGGEIVTTSPTTLISISDPNEEE